ncbi:MAG: aldo/keto reductase [Eubacteriales bacterium]|nr:aldo/keto reductase [Eubacteriales bacterium]
MEFRNLGNTDIHVSRICMGCMGFGNAATGQHSWTVDEETTRQIIRYGLEKGINFYDTAIAYQAGTSEQFVGQALRDFAKRDEVVVATKFLPRSQAEIESGESGADHVKKSLDLSLSHLGMDYVDLYIYHMWDWNTPIEEYLEALHQEVKAGKIRALGIANCFAWQLAEANAIAKENGWTPFVSVQNHYNLIMREEEREMKTYCDEHGISMTPYSALAAGRLSRKPGETTKRLEEDTYAKFKYDQSAAQDQIIIERVMNLAQKYDVSMTEISIAWLLTKVDAPICGATKLHHVDAPVAAVDLKLSESDLLYLEEAYVPHPLSGVMAQNTPDARTQKHVWIKNGEQAK